MTENGQDVGGERAALSYPRPAVTDDIAFLYEGFGRHELRLQYCADCDRHRHPPSPSCPHCSSLRWGARAVSGRGRVYSYTVHHHPPIPPYAVPHTLVLVAMQEDFRFLATISDIPPDAIHIGMAVRLRFDELEPGFTLPVFVPDQDGLP